MAADEPAAPRRREAARKLPRSGFGILEVEQAEGTRLLERGRKREHSSTLAKISPRVIPRLWPRRIPGEPHVSALLSANARKTLEIEFVIDHSTSNPIFTKLVIECSNR